MAISCNQCNHDNPDDSRFCNNCGNNLADTTNNWVAIKEKDVDAHTKLYVDGFKKAAESEATRIGQTMLVKFQDDATKWIRYQFIAVTTAVSVVIGILAYVGINGWDIKQIMTDSKNEYLEQVNLSKDILEKAKKDIKLSSADALEKIEDAKSKSKDLDAKLAAVESLRVELENRNKSFVALQTTLQKQVGEIEKIERSRYQILVHHGAPDLTKDREDSITQLRSVLYEKGYIVSADDIFNVSADKQEIIYYSDTKDMAAKVNEIINALPGHYKPISPKLETSGNNDPFQLVIKLCPNGTSSGNNCKNR